MGPQIQSLSLQAKMVCQNREVDFSFLYLSLIYISGQGLRDKKENQFMESKKGQVAKDVPEREMIDMKCCCCTAWAQLECHYEIAIMTHHLASCSNWQSHTGPELHYSITPFPLAPAAVDPHKGQEQRLHVGATYYSEGRGSYD